MSKQRTYTAPQGAIKAAERITEMGFPFIKVELEAHFGRSNTERTTLSCTDCKGTGNVGCPDCNGSGYNRNILHSLKKASGYPSLFAMAFCSTCRGSGISRCSHCAGSGRVYKDGFDIRDVSACEKYILNQLTKEERKKIVYARFYNDGSVDSELTFTVPIGELDLVTKVLTAFTSLQKITGMMDTYGAGMHISTLPTSNYPCSTRLPSNKMTNFRTQVTKLLPALYFLASPDGRSRQLGFRTPQISSNVKYSAIYTHGNTCLEYRIFETCYQRPEAYYDYVQVIERTLVYYDNPAAEVKKIGKKFKFKEGEMLHRFYDSDEALEILYRRLRTIKPLGKTMAELRKERDFNYRRKTLWERVLKKDTFLRAQFKKFLELNPDYLTRTSQIRDNLSRAMHAEGTYNYDEIQREVDGNLEEAAYKAFKYSCTSRRSTTHTVEV